ncbi:hypothetical protein PAE4_30639 [Bacillus altitudinis]|nr:hypothetical protein PAE4_30639 [Bacillus altitudinis]
MLIVENRVKVTFPFASDAPLLPQADKIIDKTRAAHSIKFFLFIVSSF